MRKILLCLILLSCNNVPTELNDKILTDEEGNIYKLEWQEGWGEAWRFKYPVTEINNGDTVTVWKYYPNPNQQTGGK